MVTMEILEFISYISLTVLSVYGLVVFRRFGRHMAELDELKEELRKCVEEEKCG